MSATRHGEDSRRSAERGTGTSPLKDTGSGPSAGAILCRPPIRAALLALSLLPALLPALVPVLALVLVLVAPLHAAAPRDEDGAGGRYHSEAFGLGLDPDPDWRIEEKPPEAGGLHVEFVLADQARLTFRALPRPGVPDAATAREISLQGVDGDTKYSDVRGEERALLGEEARPGIRLESDADGVTYVLRQTYVVQDGFVYVLQDLAEAEGFDELAPRFDALWETLTFDPPSEADLARRRLEELAARCGSEVPWAADWDEAVARAEETGRPIFATARFYPGFSLSDETMSGAFMERDVIDLLSTRFVPLRLTKSMDVPFADAAVYGFGPLTFGRAALVVDTDGQVLWQEEAVGEAVLRRALVVAGPAPESPRGLAPEDAAEWLMARGELDAAERLLVQASVTSARGWQLRARLHARRLAGPLARAALEAARAAPDGDALRGELDVDEAGLLLLEGDPDRAAALLDDFLLREPDHPRFVEALHLQGVTAWVDGDLERAEIWFRRVVNEHADTRWAWKAAATLTSTFWELGETPTPSWPDTALLAARLPVTYAPLPPDAAAEGAAAAQAWLLSHQRADGSWVSVTEALREAGEHDEFKLAITSVATLALLPHREEPGVERALRAAVGWLREAHATAAASDEPVYFMDYVVWSRSFLVLALVEAAEAGILERSDVLPSVALALGEMGARQRRNGGWSYYLTGDATSEASGPEQSISFTTAAAVLALARLRELEYPMDPALLEDALDCLEAMRTDDGSFVYMLSPGEDGTGRTGNAGDAARGPLCALALLRGGRADVDEVAGRLDVALEHRATFASELGKILMHTGPEGQGSHYLMFDHAMTAAAVATLPPERRGPYVEAVRADVLAAHTEEGAFVGTMLLGRDCGSAFALLALDALADAD